MIAFSAPAIVSAAPECCTLVGAASLLVRTLPACSLGQWHFRGLEHRCRPPLRAVQPVQQVTMTQQENRMQRVQRASASSPPDGPPVPQCGCHGAEQCAITENRKNSAFQHVLHQPGVTFLDLSISIMQSSQSIAIHVVLSLR